jgi:DNA polymerase (family X)
VVEPREKTRVPLAQAEILAQEVVTLLQPTTETIVVAGSIRRRRETVGDVEIVLKPRLTIEPDPEDLLGERTLTIDLHMRRVKELLAQGVFAHRLDRNGHPACGPRFQRLLYKGFALDIFVVFPCDQWGLQLVLRTGPAEFNQRLVTQRVQGGTILKTGQQVREGALWDCGRKVPTPDEQSLFDAVGLPWIAPEDRR